MIRRPHRTVWWSLVGVFLVLASGARAGTKVPPAELEAAVRTFLSDQRAPGNEQAEITFRTVPENVEVPGMSYRLHVAGDGRTQWKGALAVRVEVESDGRIVHRCLVSVLIRTYAEVLVAERAIGRHAEPGPEEVRTLQLETTLIQRRLLVANTTLEGLRSRQIIPRGAILYEDLFERIPLVRRGDRVLVRVRSRGVSMTTEGTARDDGERGEYVTVELATRRDRVRARIDGVRSVIVLLDAEREN
jgi:flagella basal body P-ring formation protein FlgA